MVTTWANVDAWYSLEKMRSSTSWGGANLTTEPTLAIDSQHRIRVQIFLFVHVDLADQIWEILSVFGGKD